MTRPGLLADENIAAPMVSALREAGWDILYIPERTPGVTDDEILALARTERRVLLTEDKDFGDLVFRLERDVPGVVLLRLPERVWDERLPRVKEALTRRAETLLGTYTVIEQNRIRCRHMPKS